MGNSSMHSVSSCSTGIQKAWWYNRVVTLALLLCCTAAFADGLGDNDPTKVRQVPPPGIEVPDDVRQRLEQSANEVDSILKPLRNVAALDHLLVDVDIFTRAVRTVLAHNEFFKPEEFDQAHILLAEAKRRAKQLAMSPPQHDWTQATGLVVRGYRSRIDHTVQPYGLVVPEAPHGTPKRLDIWFHGRGERMSEVGFIHQRMTNPGIYTPKNTIVLHPYGRYSNAFKFAGETDVLEALDSTIARYPVDLERVSVRGFSMGGAACWQFAVHYPDRWFAANPGAGFSETPEFLKFFQKETLSPAWYEKELWKLYDCNGYATNLLLCPTIAYSGELDIQKQAADIMADAMQKEQVSLLHVIGPQTKHSIHPDSQREIEQRMAQLAEQGRTRNPRRISFTTYSLKYNQYHWATVDALREHWLQATTLRANRKGNRVKVVTNAAAFTLDFPPGTFVLPGKVVVDVNSQTGLASSLRKSDGSLRVSFASDDGNSWRVGKLESSSPNGLLKRHGLQGPIDDAFMDSFIFVRPSGKSSSDEVERWVQAELEHAVVHWRQHFRGDARIKQDSEVTDEDIESANLVLFGTPETNSVMKKLVNQLPISWTSETLSLRESYSAAHHMPLLIYPNPLNPSRYVVLNSSFTYREYAYLNNARQVPMLPDWAVVDIREGATSQFPGRVVDADFFDEQWQLKESQGKER